MAWQSSEVRSGTMTPLEWQSSKVRIGTKGTSTISLSQKSGAWPGRCLKKKKKKKAFLTLNFVILLGNCYHSAIYIRKL
jgi:hypothetical protein